MIKRDSFRGDSNTHPQHMILKRIKAKSQLLTCNLCKLNEYGDVHVMMTVLETVTLWFVGGISYLAKTDLIKN